MGCRKFETKNVHKPKDFRIYANKPVLKAVRNFTQRYVLHVREARGDNKDKGEHMKVL